MTCKAQMPERRNQTSHIGKIRFYYWQFVGKEPNDTSISGKREEEKQKVCRQPLNMVPDVLQYEQ